MTQENKELLLIDLSARLPYGVKININGEEDTLLELGVDTGWVNASYDIEEVKPYLRPISSMTEKEKRYLMSLKYQPSALEWKNLIISSQEIIDWLNRKMFDYRGLIPLGLALEAPKDMYNTNNE